MIALIVQRVIPLHSIGGKQIGLHRQFLGDGIRRAYMYVQ